MQLHGAHAQQHLMPGDRKRKTHSLLDKGEGMEILGDHTTTCSRTNTQGTTIAFIEADKMVWYNPIIYNPEVVAYFKGLQGNGWESQA